MELIDEIRPKRIHIEEKIRGIFFYLFAYGVKDLSHLVVLIMFKIDSSLSFSSDLVAAKQRKTRNEGSSLFRLSPSVMLTVIFKELK